MQSKSGFSFTILCATLAGLAQTAFAAGAAREDHSPLVVWTFLAFCALIILAQVFPAIRGAWRAAAAERERAATERAVEVPIND